MLALDLDEASAKVRTGPPVDDDEDYELDVWAGVIPLAMQAGQLTPDPKLTPGIEPSEPVLRWAEPAPREASAAAGRRCRRSPSAAARRAVALGVVRPAST